MQTLVALLRAVNVGGTGTLPMADLRAIASAAGLADVRTYIQSGNLLCRSAEDPSAVKAALESRLAAHVGKPVEVVVRTGEALRAVLAANPFPDAAPGRVGVLFLDTPPPPGTVEAAKGRTDEEIRLGLREVFIHYPSGMGRSKLRLPVQQGGTLRNINTIGKLVALAEEGA